MKKILLVCATGCSRIEEILMRCGCAIAKVDSAAEALLRVKHEKMDAAVLVSTGQEMDCSETALNLRDMDPALNIVIFVDEAQQQTDHRDAIAGAIPKARLATTPELRRALGIGYEAGEASGDSPAGGKSHQS